jgi:NADP-dependent 3-hydroxy acid dehydrogenase YdfG
MNDYKVALVTGATGGIGGAIAKNLAQNGMKLVLTGRNKDKLDALVSELGSSVLYSEIVNFLDNDALVKFSEDIKNKDITVDVLVNNAGGALDLTSIDNYDISDITTMVDLNVRSLMVLSQIFSKEFKNNNKGHIINIGSVAGTAAYAGAAVYCAVKAAVKIFSDGCRIDLMDSDVKITNIQPGIVHTDFSLVRFKGDKAKADAVYEGIESLQAEDIAEAIWFVINQPKRVVISEMTILANQQGSSYAKYNK